jgi:hypothetical protein
MKAKNKDKGKKQPTAKEMFRKICEDNRDFFAEIVEIMSLLREIGITSYKLTGSVEEPIITYYSIC